MCVFSTLFPGGDDDRPLFMKMADEDVDALSGSDDLEESSEHGSEDDEQNEGEEEREEEEGPVRYHENKQSLYRLPTGDEMRQLKETEQLFKSNLFRLQVLIWSS